MKKTKVEEIKNLKIKSRLTTQRMHACTMKAEEKRRAGREGEQEKKKNFLKFVFPALLFCAYKRIFLLAGNHNNCRNERK